MCTLGRLWGFVWQCGIPRMTSAARCAAGPQTSAQIYRLNAHWRISVLMHGHGACLMPVASVIFRSELELSRGYLQTHALIAVYIAVTLLHKFEIQLSLQSKPSKTINTKHAW